LKVLYFTFFVVFADQVTKLLVKGFSIPFLNVYHKGMEVNSSIDVIDNFLKFTFVENPGMAFGLDFGGKQFFSIFSIVASIGILYYIYKVRTEGLLLRIPLALILGGAIGNLIDRVFYGVIYNESALFYGKVVDFIHLTFIKMDFWIFHLNGWPIFNVSDMAVTIGVLMLIVFHKKITAVKTDEPVLQAEQGIPQLSKSDSGNFGSEKGS
jgi:signal peptidase II